MTRRQALVRYAQFLLASPLLADAKYAELSDPLMRMANVFDFAKVAKEKLDPVAWDYMDEGTEDEVSLRDNRRGFDDLIIRPHFLLRDVSKVDISTTLFGKKWDHPIFLCPTGGKNCFFQGGELESAYGAFAANTMMITRGGIDPAIKEGTNAKNWWHFSTGAESATKKQVVALGERLQDGGCSGISVTVDIYHVSHRERSIHNGLVRGWCESGGVPRDGAGKLVYKPTDVVWTSGSMPPVRPMATPTWDRLKLMRDNIPDLPIIIKGILTSEDTANAVKYGMSGIVVSNHGARQLDNVGGTIEALPECVQAAGGKIPVLLDGGIRRGTDIFKALALGASAVGIGRPYLWGLSSFGRRGVTRVVELLRSELAVDMGMAGVSQISEIDRSYVRARR